MPTEKQHGTEGTMPERHLGATFVVSAIGYGAMGLSEFYGAPPQDAASVKLLDRALELGVSLFDTADMYGRGHNERLIGRFLARHKAERLAGRCAVATKFGIDRAEDDSYKRRINNDPAYIRAACEASLARLGVERIDLYYAHRLDPRADLAATMGTLADLVREGKVRAVGLCEVSAATLRQAHALHPVTAVQSEYSLWTREAEAGVLPACRELGIGFVAYSPLGRGFLTGGLKALDTLDAGDFRLSNPRFQGEHFERNLRLLPALEQVARRHGCTPARVALAWLLGRAERLVAIPGTRHPGRLEDNCAAARLTLSPQDRAGLEAVFTPEAVSGARYTPEGMKGVNA